MGRMCTSKVLCLRARPSCTWPPRSMRLDGGGVSEVFRRAAGAGFLTEALRDARALTGDRARGT